jgi:hypothetical protein
MLVMNVFVSHDSSVASIYAFLSNHVEGALNRNT